MYYILIKNNNKITENILKYFKNKTHNLGKVMQMVLTPQKCVQYCSHKCVTEYCLIYYRTEKYKVNRVKIYI